MERLSRFEWGCVGVLVAAALLRVAFIVEPDFIWDSAWFLMLARSFGETGTFLLRWSDPAAPQYSGYWPPLFPVFASAFVKVLGPDYRALVVASCTAAALLVTAVFFTTRDLFDRPRAFAAAALVAASPAFYTSDAKGMSESLLGLTVVLTLWAFLRSLERPRYLALAALFAFLAYLGKASLGLPFVAVGILALAAWRVSTRGWRATLRSPLDLGIAAAGALGMAVLALTRTERIGGLGLGLIEPLRRGVMSADCGELGAAITLSSTWTPHVGPHCWALAFPLKVLFVCAFLFVVTLPLSLRLPKLLRQRRTERTDAMWLAVILPVVAGAVFTTTFFFTEHRQFFDFDNIRYLTPAIVPFIWLLLPLWTFEAEPDAADDGLRRRHLAWYWTGVGAFVLVALFNPLIGAETLGRFLLLLVLGLVAVGISLGARVTSYQVAERRVGASVERRIVRSPATPEARGIVAIAAALLAVAGYFYSSWYVVVGMGLVVALATPSPARRAAAMALIILASAAPTVFFTLPVDEAVEATSAFPEGTVVGMSEIVVFPAAVAPDALVVRTLDPDAPIPDEVDAMLLQYDFARRDYDGFTRVHSWPARTGTFPTLAARLWIEEHALGTYRPSVEAPALSLYVRNGTALAG